MSDTQTKTSGTDKNNTATSAQEAVGNLLSNARHDQGVDISDVARALRISQKYLEALEEGRNQDLPGAAYAIGFVRSYGEYLKLDGDEIVRRYKDEDEGLADKTKLIFPKPIPDGGVPGAAVLGLGVVIAFVAYGVWYWNSNNDNIKVTHVEPVPQELAITKETPPKTAIDKPEVQEKPVVEVIKSTPDLESAPNLVVMDAPKPAVKTTPVVQTPVVVEPVVVEPAAVEDPVVKTPVIEVKVPAVKVEPVQTPLIKATPAGDEKPKATAVVQEPVVKALPVIKKTHSSVTKVASRITIRASADSWIQVRDVSTNRLLFSRLIHAGEQYDVPNRSGLRLMTGNAGALEVLVDGKSVPAIGTVGEVRRDVDLDPDQLKSGAVVTP